MNQKLQWISTGILTCLLILAGLYFVFRDENTIIDAEIGGNGGGMYVPPHNCTVDFHGCGFFQTLQANKLGNTITINTSASSRQTFVVTILNVNDNRIDYRGETFHDSRDISYISYDVNELPVRIILQHENDLCIRTF